MNSALETKISVIKERIEKYRAYFIRNEEATKIQLILPILKSLGWEPDHPEDVVYEEKTETNRKADISLKLNDVIKLFIEAKELSTDIKTATVLQQLQNYLNTEGMDYGVLTNGETWLILEAHRAGVTITGLIINSIDIMRDDFDKIKKFLSIISKEKIDSLKDNINMWIKDKDFEDAWKKWFDGYKNKKYTIFDYTVFENELSNKGYKKNDIKTYFNMKFQRIVGGNENVPENPVSDFIEKPIEKKEVFKIQDRPKILTIGDNEYPVRYWQDVWKISLEFLLKDKNISKNNIPGIIKNYVSLDGKGKTGRNYVSKKELSNGLLYEANYSAKSIIKIVKKLFKDFGYHENIISWK